MNTEPSVAKRPTVTKRQAPAFYELRGGVIDSQTHRTVLRLDRFNITAAQSVRIMDTILTALNAEFPEGGITDLRWPE